MNGIGIGKGVEATVADEGSVFIEDSSFTLFNVLVSSDSASARRIKSECRRLFCWSFLSSICFSFNLCLSSLIVSGVILNSNLISLSYLNWIGGGFSVFLLSSFDYS